MKKLMLLAVMLAMVMAAAIPALAQNFELNPGLEPADDDELICLLPEGCDTGTSIEPAPGEVERDPGYGHVEPTSGDIEPAPGHGHVEPAPGDADSGDCSEALEDSIIRRASDPSPVPDGTSVVPAKEPGCFAIPVPAPADGSSEVHSW